MRRTSVALSLVGVSIALAACTSDRDSTSPRSIAPGSLSATILPASCVPNNISNTAKNYFPRNDAVFDSIATMKGVLSSTSSTVQATPSGFAVLARTATVRRKGVQTGTNVQGAAFVNAVLGCMSVGTAPAAFDPTKALGNGIFEVRTGGVNEGFAVAFTALTAKTTTVPSPEYGAEAATPSSAPVWPSTSGMPGTNRFLVYGYPLGTNNDVLTDGFELGSLPVANATSGPTVNIAANPLAVGICASSSVAGSNGSVTARLLLHNNSEYLNLQKLGFCSQTITVGSSTSWLRALPSRMLALINPTTLFAQDATDNFIGGLPSGWSPNVIKGFVNTDITLSFYQQPVNAQLQQTTEQIIVQAVTTADVMPPANIRLTIANNQGSPAFLTTSLGGTPQSFVDVPLTLQTINGVTGYFAQYTIGFTKAGGYTLTATGFIGGGGVATPSVISNLFNVKNQ